MDSSVSLEDEIWFLRVCHHISNAVYKGPASNVTEVKTLKLVFQLVRDA